MTEQEAILILRNEWKKSVGDYRYQNPQKLDREEALDKAIVALEQINPSVVKYINGGHAVCPVCGCDLHRYYSFCFDCGQALKWED